MIAAGFVKTGNQMSAPRTGGACTHPEATGEFGLAGGGQRRSLFMADADPFDLAPSNRVREGIERVTDQSEYVLDPYLFKNTNQHFSNRLHLPLLTGALYRT
jgi:hypothetical protein